MIATEYEFEPTPGLPELLPESERLVWKGQPDPVRLAIRAMRLRAVAAWFGLIAFWQIVSQIHDGAPLKEVLLAPTWTFMLAIVAIGVLGAVGYALGRSTIYTVTSKRVVVRHGIALEMAINLPFSKIASAGVRLDRDGTGDIALTLGKGSRVAYLALWPHARPFRFLNPEPMLRAVPDAPAVARLIARSLAESVAEPASGIRIVRRPAKVAAPAAAQPVGATIGPEIRVAS